MIPLMKYLLIIGGIILLIDAMTSIIFVRDQRWFCQAVRCERWIFAMIVILAGVTL